YLFFCSIISSPILLYTLSLHDALPISCPNGNLCVFAINPNGTTKWMWDSQSDHCGFQGTPAVGLNGDIYFASMSCVGFVALSSTDRKSTRLNSSHQIISYAVFCLKKKK